jgi:hypothetical protein
MNEKSDETLPSAFTASSLLLFVQKVITTLQQMLHMVLFQGVEN